MTNQSECNHEFKKPLEFFIPSIELYGKEKIDWVLYTVDDKENTVYIDSADFTGPRQRVGTGGIVLRNLRLVYRKHLLNDPKIFLELNETLKADSNQAKEILKLLSYLEELYRNVDYFTLADLNFDNENLYPTLNMTKSPFMKFVDLSGNIKLTEVLSDIQVHGQWGAKNIKA